MNTFQLMIYITNDEVELHCHKLQPVSCKHQEECYFTVPGACITIRQTTWHEVIFPLISYS